MDDIGYDATSVNDLDSLAAAVREAAIRPRVAAVWSAIKKVIA